MERTPEKIKSDLLQRVSQLCKEAETELQELKNAKRLS
jgi:hypothetical protein